jgi:hypothetical protein
VNNLRFEDVESLTENFPWLKDLAISVLVSSIGTNFTLAMIIIDCVGITHFIPWEAEQQEVKTQENTPSSPSQITTQENTDSNEPISIRKKIRNLSIFFFIFNLTLVAMIATNRIAFMGGEDSRLLSKNWEYTLELLSSISQTLIIIPMLFTTFSLFWGVMIIVVIYFLFIGVLILGLTSLQGSVKLLNGLMTMAKPASIMTLGLVLAGFAFIFTQLGLLLGLILRISDRITSVIEAALETLITIFSFFINIPIKLINFVQKLFASLFQSKNEDDSTPQSTVK